MKTRFLRQLFGFVALMTAFALGAPAHAASLEVSPRVVVAAIESASPDAATPDAATTTSDVKDDKKPKPKPKPGPRDDGDGDA